MIKKLLSILLVFIMILAMFPVGLIKIYALQSGDFTYEIYNGKAEITGYTGVLTALTIPDTLDTYTVTSIGANAFTTNTSLISVVMPNTITAIGENAFNGLTMLNSVIISCNTVSIASGAFKGCTGLVYITIPESVASIGDSVFENCTKLYKAYFYGNAPAAGGALIFNNCKSGFLGFTLNYVSGKSGFDSQPWSAYKQTTFVPLNGAAFQIGPLSPTHDSLTITIFHAYDAAYKEYKVGNGEWAAYTVPIVITENTTVYARCKDAAGNIGAVSSTAIDTILYQGYYYSVTNSVAQIYNYIGTGGAITIPATLGGYPVTSIAASAFQSCSVITSLTIPGNITSIGDYAFQYCTNLTNVDLQYGVASLGKNVFSGCTKLLSASIPNSVTSIPDKVFYGCNSLASVSLSNSLTSIGLSVFENCSALADITMPNRVTNILDRAFYNCSKLKMTSWPNNLQSIGISAFENCSSLTNLLLPDSVTSISNRAFYNCSKLASIYMPVNLATFGQYVFAYCTSLPGITIQGKFGTISNYAFQGCSSLSNITISSDITIIGANAFEGCSNISALTIPNSITQINDFAFKDCSGLGSITIPNSVFSIGTGVFIGCTQLTGISVENGGFRYHDFDGVLVDNKNSQVLQYPAGRSGDYIMPVSYKIADYAFYGCTKLTGITIRTGVPSIGSYAFYNCSGLSSLVIPDSITTINSSAFYGCSGLTKLIFPNGVKTIGTYAFKSCTGLSKVYFLGIAPTLGTDVFSLCAGGFRVYFINGKTGFSNPWYGYTALSFVPPSAPSFSATPLTPTSGDVSVSISYPPGAINTEYKVGSTGVWTPYTEPVILQYNDTVYAKCLDSEGVPSDISSTIISNIYKYPPNNPVINTNPSTATNKPVTISIIYPSDAVVMEYKIGEGEWSNYTTPISVTSNCSIYARCSNVVGMASGITAYVVDYIYAGDFSYTISNSEVEITGYLGSGTTFTIPDSIEGLPVKSIGSNAFSNLRYLTNATLPVNLTSIGDKAFYELANLKTVTITSSLTSIGDYAFSGCIMLTTLNLPQSVTHIGSYAFEGCAIIQTTIPDTLVYIGDDAFDSCRMLTGVLNLNLATYVGSSAFEDCRLLTAINLGDKLTSISPCAFSYCTALTSVSMGTGITKIGGCAFQACPALTNIVFGCNVQIIGIRSFDMCRSLTNVSNPISLKSICDYAFEDCSMLSNITIPINVENIGQEVFDGCSALTQINVDIHNNSFSSQDGVLFNKEKTTLLVCPSGKSGRYLIPNSVCIVGDFAFEKCNLLSNISIGSNVTVIENNAFSDSGLISIIIPSNVKEICSQAFLGCNGLSKVYFCDIAPAMESGASGVFYTDYLSIFRIDYVSGKNGFPNPLDGIPTETFVPLATPTFTASSTEPTIGNVEITITYPDDAAIKEFRFNGGEWAPYTGPISLSANDTVYARCEDAVGKPSQIGSQVVDNIIDTIVADPGSTTVIDQNSHIIYGLHAGMTQDQFETDYIHFSGNMHADYTYVSGVFGTGTQVSIIDGTAKAVLETYTIVIFGDVNGDGNIDSIDAGKIVDIQNYMTSWDPVADAAFYKAADVNGDGNIDSIDAGLLVDSQNYMAQIDQTTGLAG